VHISTDQVYDGDGPGHSEDAVTLRNMYAFSKYAGELAAMRIASVVLRTNFFGPSRCPGRASLSDWLVGALRSSTSITVFEDVYFSPLALQTLCEMIEMTLSSPRTGLYNLGSRDGMSKAQFAFLLAEVLGLPSRSMRRGRIAESILKAPRPSNMRMKCARFEQQFGVSLPSLENEIQSMRGAYAHAA
jgi:dTDP-4-dehydrorhamnose reductase